MLGRVQYCIFTFLFNLKSLVEIGSHVFPLLSASHFLLCSLSDSREFSSEFGRREQSSRNKELLTNKEMQITMRCDFLPVMLVIMKR